MSRNRHKKTHKNNDLIVFCDGGHNYGRCSCATVIFHCGNPICSETEAFFGTNNDAEYRGLLLGLRKLREMSNRMSGSQVTIKMDSKLIVSQVNGSWKCNIQRLQDLRDRCRDEINGLRGIYRSVLLTWVPREQNTDADALCQSQLVVRDAYL